MDSVPTNRRSATVFNGILFYTPRNAFVSGSSVESVARLLFLTSGSKLHILSSEGLPFALAFELMFTGACKVPGVVGPFSALFHIR